METEQEALSIFSILAAREMESDIRKIFLAVGVTSTALSHEGMLVFSNRLDNISSSLLVLSQRNNGLNGC